MLLPVRTVGVMGDGRTYDSVVALRAVTSVDGMTADFYPFDMSFLGRAATRIINEVKGVNRVVYDVTASRRGRSSGSERRCDRAPLPKRRARRSPAFEARPDPGVTQPALPTPAQPPASPRTSSKARFHPRRRREAAHRRSCPAHLSLLRRQ